MAQPQRQSTPLEQWPGCEAPKEKMFFDNNSFVDI